MAATKPQDQNPPDSQDEPEIAGEAYSDERYQILHSAVSKFYKGEIVTAEQLGEENIARLIELEAIAPEE